MHKSILGTPGAFFRNNKVKKKIDFLTSKVNEILYELNYLKDDLVKAKSSLSAIQTENFLLNSNMLFVKT